MQQRRLGSTKVQVPVLGQGTWRLRDHTASRAALEEGLRLGLTHLDTAELYERQSGSETLLGGMLPGRREEVFLASKVLPQNASYEGTLAACEASLKRLGTDRLDLYYLHWRGEHPLEETFDAMAQLVEDGKVRHIGVSNFDVPDLEEAEAILGKGVLAANQVYYHLEDRGIESDVLPWCKAHGVTVVAYSPFGAGNFLLGRRQRAAAEAVARDCNLTVHQLALAFLTRDPSVVAIPKTEAVARVRENAGGAVALSKQAIAALDEAFPVEPGLRTV
jgi:diketogulonate reductase-like aldo/keto reductase